MLCQNQTLTDMFPPNENEKFKCFENDKEENRFLIALHWSNFLQV